MPYNQPKLVTGGLLRPYQLEGMEWIKVRCLLILKSLDPSSLQSLYENGVNGILGDEMGLGKTLQCIAFIAYMIEKGVKGPFLVAAPLSTVPNWVSEFKKFTPKVSDVHDRHERVGLWYNEHPKGFSLVYTPIARCRHADPSGALSRNSHRARGPPSKDVFQHPRGALLQEESQGVETSRG